MLSSQAAQDAIANNLANANTVGYKRDIPELQSFSSALSRSSNSPFGASAGALGSGVDMRQYAVDFAQGALEQTGNPYDIALSGDASIAVNKGNGVVYSRDGSLTRNIKGQLVQVNGGGTVLDSAGKPIVIPINVKNVEFTAAGKVVADGKTIAQLKLQALNISTGAFKIGDSAYGVTALRSPSPGFGVRQGYLEASNVSVVKEMIQMVTSMRAYETDQKMIQAEDSATGKAVNEVARG